jgi:hypothetical protein
MKKECMRKKRIQQSMEYNVLSDTDLCAPVCMQIVQHDFAFHIQ